MTESENTQASLLDASTAPEARVVSFNNIPPLTSNDAWDLSTGGEDKGKLSMWVSFDQKRFLELARGLDKLKSEAQETGNSAFYVIGETAWEVHKSGFHLGQGEKKGGPYFRWQLRHGGVKFGLANRVVAYKQNGAPNVWLEIGSEVLMVSGGMKPVFDEFLETLKALGGYVNADILSEVHVCADWPNVDIAEFSERFHKHQYVSRAKRKKTHATTAGDEVTTCSYGFGSKQTGFELGSVIRLIVYEKAFEVRSNIIKKAIMERVRWGGPVDQAIRFEFQIRRETLKSRGIHTQADWEREKAGFIRWLTEDWFRMTEEDVDRTNTTRAKTWKNWQIVQALFAEWAGAGPKPPKLGLGIHLDPKALIKQAAGCISQAMALRGMGATNMTEFLDASMRLLRGYTSIEEMIAKLERKYQTLSAKSPRKKFFSWGR